MRKEKGTGNEQRGIEGTLNSLTGEDEEGWRRSVQVLMCRAVGATEGEADDEDGLW